MSELTRRNALKAAAAGGLFAVAGPIAEPAAEAQNRQRPKDRWRAWAVTEGEHTKLVVEGIYTEGGPGLVVLVQPAKPQGINPKNLLLEVKTATLPGIWPAVLQPVPAHYVQAPYEAGTYDSVHIRYPDGTGIDVRQITDTGKGPAVNQPRRQE